MKTISKTRNWNRIGVAASLLAGSLALGAGPANAYDSGLTPYLIKSAWVGAFGELCITNHGTPAPCVLLACDHNNEQQKFYILNEQYTDMDVHANVGYGYIAFAKDYSEMDNQFAEVTQYPEKIGVMPRYLPPTQRLRVNQMLDTWVILVICRSNTPTSCFMKHRTWSLLQGVFRAAPILHE